MTASAAPLVVVAAVIESDDGILVCRRRAGKAAAGRWEFPGGKVDPGETAAEALVREIREELGVDVVVTGELTTDDTADIRLVCLRAGLTGERPTTSTDHDALEWVPREQLPVRDWAEPDLPAVRLLSGG